jgi:phosphoribosylanthranilate isomerase
VFVKICGVTNEEDALLAVAMGADAVGFVFAPSKRQIAPTAARDIVRRLPHEILTVGVFRDQAAQQVVDTVNLVGLRGAQLHGHESPAEAAWVRKRVPFVVKAFSAGDRMFDRMGDYEVDAIMLDSAVPGSGKLFDWALAENLPVDKRLILAGGLTPDNVAESIARVSPWGVDVSTGVEVSPGHKDPRKVMRFVAAAKAAGEADDPGTASLDLGATDEVEPYDYDWEEGTYAG